jgi:hypothetical protein
MRARRLALNRDTHEQERLKLSSTILFRAEKRFYILKFWKPVYELIMRNFANGEQLKTC